MSLWRIELLGELRAISGERVLTRFESQRVAALLARLCLFPRAHPREELIAALWPETDLSTGRNRLRNALSVLRSLLQTPENPTGSALQVDRFAVSLVAATFETDVAQWERLVKSGRVADADALWKGELLPGFYDDWILNERERLNALHDAIARDGPIPTATPTPASAEPTPGASGARVFLPAWPTRFFGRDSERGELAARLKSERLVSVIGPGGVGKTRLSVEVARAVAPDFAGGAAFAPLSERFVADGLIESVCAALRLPTSRDPLEVLRRHARESPTLLLLDNFEQLVETGGAECVALLLARIPELTLLVTTRRALGIDGEREFRLAPLDERPATELFLDRARAVRPTFALQGDNQNAVRAICEKLEGLPLALELAASRVRGHSLSQMRTALDDRLSLLIRHSGGSKKSHRHGSLRATIEWSWHLLSPTTRRCLARFSVFVGGATVDSVAEICDEPDAQTRLEALVADSLLVATEPEDQPESGVENTAMRFFALESIREFAASQLPPDDLAATRARFRSHFYTRIARAVDDDMNYLDTIPSDLDNIESAIEEGWRVERTDELYRAVTGFLAFSFVRGQHRRATLWAGRVIESWRSIPDPSTRLTAVSWALGILVDQARLDEARALNDEALADARAAGLEGLVVRAKLNQGYIENILGNFDASVAIQREALADARRITVENSAFASLPEPARSRMLVQALFLTARALTSLAVGTGREKPDEIATARALWSESDALASEALQRIGPSSYMRALLNLTRALSLRGLNRDEDSWEALKLAQYWARRHSIMALLMFTFWHESHAELRHGSARRAAFLLGAYRRLREQMGYNVPEIADAESEHERTLRARLGDQTFEESLADASSRPPDSLVEARAWADLKPDSSDLAIV